MSALGRILRKNGMNATPRFNSCELVFVAIYLGIVLDDVVPRILGGEDTKLAADVISHIVVPAIAIAWLCTKDAQWANALRQGLRCSLASILGGLFLGFCFAVLYMFAAQLSIPGLGIAGADSAGAFLSAVVKRYGMFGVLYLSITAAVLEELLFKPILLGALNRTVSQTGFCLVSTFLFVFLHLSQGVLAVSAIAVYGWLTAIYFYQERRLASLVVMHFMADTLMFSLLL